jgi:hypothetical protein
MQRSAVVEDFRLRLKLDLEEDATVKLIERAAAEKRPVGRQAEALLRKALGLPAHQERAGEPQQKCHWGTE